MEILLAVLCMVLPLLAFFPNSQRSHDPDDPEWDRAEHCDALSKLASACRGGSGTGVDEYGEHQP
jgi:hypothetical protein